MKIIKLKFKSIVEQTKELYLPVIEGISFTGSNFSEIIGGKIYIKPLLSFAGSQNPSSKK
jgi:hypothetical protein